MSRVKYTTAEVDLLARLIKSEALGEGDEGMLLVGNVVVNRVNARCDVFTNLRTVTDVIYQKNAFAGVNTPLFNQGVNSRERELALRCLEHYRNEPAYNALWFKNPGATVTCPAEFYGILSGRYRQHCFYNPSQDCEL